MRFRLSSSLHRSHRFQDGQQAVADGGRCGCSACLRMSFLCLFPILFGAFSLDATACAQRHARRATEQTCRQASIALVSVPLTLLARLRGCRSACVCGRRESDGASGAPDVLEMLPSGLVRPCQDDVQDLDVQSRPHCLPSLFRRGAPAREDLAR